MKNPDNNDVLNYDDNLIILISTNHRFIGVRMAQIASMYLRGEYKNENIPKLDKYLNNGNQEEFVKNYTIRLNQVSRKFSISDETLFYRSINLKTLKPLKIEDLFLLKGFTYVTEDLKVVQNYTNKKKKHSNYIFEILTPRFTKILNLDPKYVSNEAHVRLDIKELILPPCTILQITSLKEFEDNILIRCTIIFQPNFLNYFTMKEYIQSDDSSIMDKIQVKKYDLFDSFSPNFNQLYDKLIDNFDYKNSIKHFFNNKKITKLHFTCYVTSNDQIENILKQKLIKIHLTKDEVLFKSPFNTCDISTGICEETKVYELKIKTYNYSGRIRDNEYFIHFNKILFIHFIKMKKESSEIYTYEIK